MPITDQDVPLYPGAIHRPDDASHFMRIKPVERQVFVAANGRELARTTRAVRVLEAGRDLYDPVLYLPREDVSVPLAPASQAATHCPLKGEASYWALDEGERWIAWSYDAPKPWAEALQGFVAFDAGQVQVTEG